ncbi:unnamed protein product [Pylaiella littoralis]
MLGHGRARPRVCVRIRQGRCRATGALGRWRGSGELGRGRA